MKMNYDLQKPNTFHKQLSPEGESFVDILWEKLFRMLFLPFQFAYTFCNTSNSSNRKIRRKGKSLSNFDITKFMPLSGIARIFLNRSVEDMVARLCKTLTRFFKSQRSQNKRIELGAHCSSEPIKYYLLHKELKQLEQERGFLPPLKGWGSTSSNG